MDFNLRVPPQQSTTPGLNPSKPAHKPQSGEFARVWQDAVQKQELKFSAHALQRMESRQIKLAEADLDKISAAIAGADRKGARSSLLLYNDLAMVASVRNRTIVTAISGEELKEHVFTNIDSAVIIR
jgi:flagellar operon protein